jgi:pyridoxine 4-dehydrogenase
LLQRAPNILLIPGTSSIGHLQENLAAGDIVLPAEAIAALDRIGAESPAH